MNPSTFFSSATLWVLLMMSLNPAFARDPGTGNFSLGTRNTISLFSEDRAVGTGIGGQFRFQFNDKLNSEWYADYIPSSTRLTWREDFHIGWSVLFYPGKNVRFDHLLQPYLIAGHCFDYSVVRDKKNSNNMADRFTSATQAGVGTHFNITKRFDCSVSAQYMLHFGREIEIRERAGEKVDINRSEVIRPDGHLLFTVSFNYKFVNFWNGWKSI